MKLKKLSAVKLHTMTVLYGRPGSGKTSKINSLPGKVLVIDTDRGLASVEPKDTVAVAECETYNDVLEALAMAKDFDSIAIDHMTNVQELCYKHLLSELGRDKMTLPLYGDATQLLKKLVDELVELSYSGKNILVLVQERSVNTEPEDAGKDDVPPQIMPNLMPGIGSYLTASSRIVGHTEKVNKTKVIKGDKITKEFFSVRLGGNPLFTTKVTRRPGLEVPDTLVNADWETLVGLTDGTTQAKMAKKEGDK